MRYETFLFTRNQRQDFTAFVRPARLTNKQISAVGGIFNYANDVSRLTPDFPSLYCFPLGDYFLLLRHYDSGRTHAGRAIGVIEGIAVAQDDNADFRRALSALVEGQADLLNVSATIDDIEAQAAEPSPEYDWSGSSSPLSAEPFVREFLERRTEDRLFLPFTPQGRDLLVSALADRRFASPPFFAFGTNSDVLDQLAQHGEIDIASFFSTERPCFRSRATNRLSDTIEGYDDAAPLDPSMALRPPTVSEMRLRPQPVLADEPDEDEETFVGAEGMSLRASGWHEPRQIDDEPEDDEGEPAVLTLRQMRDKILAEEAAAQGESEERPRPDPIHWLLRLLSTLVSPRKTR